jgi:hypothetical protein
MSKPTMPPTDTPGGNLAGANRNPGGTFANPGFQIQTGQDSDGIIRNSDGTRTWGSWPLSGEDD